MDRPVVRTAATVERPQPSAHKDLITSVVYRTACLLRLQDQLRLARSTTVLCRYQLHSAVCIDNDINPEPQLQPSFASSKIPMDGTPQQPMAPRVGQRQQQHHKMSINFIIGQTNESMEVTGQYSTPPPATVPAPIREAAPSSQKSHPQAEIPGPLVTLPPLYHAVSGRFDDLRPVSHLPRVASFCSNSGSPPSTSSMAGDDANHLCGTTSSSPTISTDTSPVQYHGNISISVSSASAPILKTSSHSSKSLSSVNKTCGDNSHYHHHSQRPTRASTAAEPLARIPRPSRPSYTEEQKFFIMYYRVLKELSWPEIEDKFASFFKLRTKDGLTSVYYRIRKSWGMEEVLKAGLDGSMSDRGKVETRAAHFSREFLADLGYFD